jgi:hypothetical protein
LVVVVVLLATTVLTACSNEPKQVLVIGDSISLGAAGELVTMGNNVASTDDINRITFSIVANQMVGARRTVGPPEDPDDYWPTLIARSIEQPGTFDAVVVELGTNDCAGLTATGDYLPDIARIVGAIVRADPGVPIRWLVPKQHPDFPGCADLIRGDLEGAVSSGTYPQLATWDYGAWADAHPECFLDGIHPTERWHTDPRSGGTPGPIPTGYCAGQFEYARWLKARLDAQLGPPG